MKFKYDKSSVSEEEMQKAAEGLFSYTQQLKEVTQNGYDDDESSINLPFDKEMLDRVGAVVADKMTPGLKYIIVIGIGGSNLGTKAVYDALHGYTDILNPDRYPKCIFVDTNSPTFLSSLSAFFHAHVQQPEEIVVNAISKSGSTTETIANTEIVMAELEKKFPMVSDRLVITTDFGSKMWKAAEEKGIAALPIPEKVGGRYSVLSSVGLFPLAMAGFNITALLGGAQNMRDSCLSEDIGKNTALASAIILHSNYKQGYVINDNFIFNPELESLGKWYRQLLGESIGKRDDVGITPTVSIGSTDLHSVGQLYLGGPKNKITTFISAKNEKGNKISNKLLPGLVDGIEGKTPNDIMSAILEGVKYAYGNRDLPFMEIELGDISESSIGAFMQFKMMEMMYLGKMFDVNPFDQPNVEDYKSETKKILNK